MPLVTVAGTVGGLVNDVTDISETVENATGGVRNAMAQTTELTSALDEAQKNAAAAASSVKVPNLEVPEVPKVNVPNLEVPEVKVPEVKVPEVKVPVPVSEVPPRRSDYPTGDDGLAAYDAAQEKFVANKRSRIGVPPEVQPQSIKMKTGVDAPPTIQPIERQPAAAAVTGGSRKRRRIHKLSRRIERTLRRVQKKYGLRDDKNSFLRRTLNAKKMK